MKKKESKEKKEDDPAKEKEKAEKEKAEAGPSPPEKSKEEVDEADLPDLVLWHWQDKRLQSQQQVEENRDKNFSYLCIYRIKEKTFIRLADEKLRQVEAAPKDRWAIGLDNSEYQLASSLDGRRYQDIYVIDLITGELRKAKKAEIFLYTRETYKDYPEFYVADGALQNGQKITETNPQQKDFLWSSGSMLVEYQSAKGAKLQAALFLPANYEKGKSYPAVVYIYEKLSQGLNRYYAPSANGFNKSVYTSRGYAVLMPDITYQINDPGMSAVWCVLPAPQWLIEGVSHLKLKDHLKERVKAMKPAGSEVAEKK